MATPRLGLVVEDKPTELSCKCVGSISKTLLIMLCCECLPYSLNQHSLISCHRMET